MALNIWIRNRSTKHYFAKILIENKNEYSAVAVPSVITSIIAGQFLMKFRHPKFFLALDSGSEIVLESTISSKTLWHVKMTTL